VPIEKEGEKKKKKAGSHVFLRKTEKGGGGKWVGEERGKGSKEMESPRPINPINEKRKVAIRCPSTEPRERGEGAAGGGKGGEQNIGFL